MPKVQTAPIIGLPQANRWSHTVINEKKNLYVTFSIAGENAKNFGKEIEDYLYQIQVKSAEQFHQLILDLVAKTRQNRYDFHMAAILRLSDKVFYATYNGQILLKRDHKIGKILLSNQEIKLIQGKFNENDILCLATTDAASFLSEIKLKLKQGFELKSIIKNVKEGIKKPSSSSLAALNLLYFEEEKPLDKEKEQGLEINLNISSDETENSDQTSMDTATDEDDNKKNIKTTTKKNNSAIDKKADNGKPLSKADDQSIALQSKNQNTKVEKPTSSKTSKKETALNSHQTSQSKTEKQQDYAKIIAKKEAQEAAKKKRQENFNKLLNFFKKTGQKILNLIKFIGKKIITFIKKYVLSFFNRNEVYVKKKFNKKILILVVVILLSLAGFFTYKAVIKQKNELIQEKVNQKLEPINIIVADARRQYQQEPIQARNKVNLAISRLNSLIQAYQDDESIQQELTQKKENLITLEKKISGVVSQNKLNIFYDTRKIQSDSLLHFLLRDEDYLYGLDKGKKNLMLIHQDNKSNQNLALNFEEAITDVAYDKDSQVFFFLSDGIKILTLPTDLNEAKILQLKEAGSSDDGGEIIEHFANYLYVLNLDKRNIYRYIIEDYDQGIEDGAFEDWSTSDPIGWLTSKKDLEFDQLYDMEIDGDLWLSTTNGQIFKFSKGEPAEFNITGLKKEFNSPIKIYTKKDYQNLYVLEPGQKRLVVLNKDGLYLREFNSSSLAGATDFTVNPSEEKAFIINGSIIYQIDL